MTPDNPSFHDKCLAAINETLTEMIRQHLAERFDEPYDAEELAKACFNWRAVIVTEDTSK